MKHLSKSPILISLVVWQYSILHVFEIANHGGFIGNKAKHSAGTKDKKNQFHEINSSYTIITMKVSL